VDGSFYRRREIDPTTSHATFGSGYPVAQELCVSRNQNTASQICDSSKCVTEFPKMNGIIYLVGLVVVILAILSFFGLR
jgi:hypothetical protein